VGRLLEQDVEQGLKGFAAGVEQTLDKLVSGELGSEMTHYMDALLSGFIRGFEANYSKFEEAVRQTFGLQGASKGLLGASTERISRKARTSSRPSLGLKPAPGRRKPVTRRQANLRQHLWNWQVFGQSNSDTSE
jgi:hypothetical protein